MRFSVRKHLPPKLPRERKKRKEEKSTMAKIGVLRFPGSNCDEDTFQALEATGHKALWLWHRDTFHWQNWDAFILPGGFTYGDYLRPGAFAARCPAMVSLREAAQKGVPILGICNGFQILCEAQLLPGILLQNHRRRFIDTWQSLTSSLHKEETACTWPGKENIPSKLRLPIAHGCGAYYIPPEGLKALKDQGQICFHYEGENPNGSMASIAGVCDISGRILGLMPHPERAMAPWMGGEDGKFFFHF